MPTPKMFPRILDLFCECAAELKNLPGFKAPIIGLTFSDHENDKVAGVNVGIIAFLTKPIEALFDTVEPRDVALAGIALD